MDLILCLCLYWLSLQIPELEVFILSGLCKFWSFYRYIEMEIIYQDTSQKVLISLYFLSSRMLADINIFSSLLLTLLKVRFFNNLNCCQVSELALISCLRDVHVQGNSRRVFLIAARFLQAWLSYWTTGSFLIYEHSICLFTKTKTLFSKVYIKFPIDLY